MSSRNSALILLLAILGALPRVASGQVALPHLPIAPAEPPVAAPVEVPPTFKPAPPAPDPAPPAGGTAAPQEAPPAATQATDPGPPPPSSPSPRSGSLEVSPAEDRWPARYVDRPQTLREGMGQLSLTLRQYFDGPAGYDRRLSYATYEYGVTDDLQLGVTLGRITCDGHGAGRCADQFDLFSDVIGGVTYAARRSPRSLLALQGSFERSNFGTARTCRRGSSSSFPT